MREKIGVNAIILAAGIGTRLRPVTDFIPKPLMPVDGTPLLESIILKMKNAGVAKVAVNTHHLADRVEAFVENSQYAGYVTLYHEKEILGTGGPLVNARNLLSEADCFVLYNGDILSDIDVGKLVDFHRASGKIATMVIINGPENRVLTTLGSKNSGTVIDILGKLGKTSPSARLLTYTGIAVFSKEIFKYLPDQPVNCSMITAILDALREIPASVGAYLPDKMLWNDIGTVGKYFSLLSSPLKQKPQTPAKSPIRISSLVEQGSNRKFYRISYPDSSRVVMVSYPEDQDFDRFIKVGEYLFKNGLGTPQIFSHDKSQLAVLLEDLGDDTVHSVIRKKNKSEVYRKVIDWLVEFQKRTCELGDECRHEINRSFDYPGIRWETEYFTENFLKRYLGESEEKCAELLTRFDVLAQESLKQPQVLIHRDFQSQNILIKDDKVRIVDYQGTRYGPVAYDLMSLLKDAYVDIPVALRRELQEYYYRKIQGTRIKELTFTKEQFRKYAVIAGLQRNMQALGAFTFLALVKGKQRYLSYIPIGVKNLIEGIDELEALPDRPVTLTALLGMLVDNPKLER
ncbi:MAG: sugar phosphate nucleotidyltransferase [Victivallales bacterium]